MWQAWQGDRALSEGPLSLVMPWLLLLQVGEGLEAEQKDFAAEVAETLKSVA